jgi:large subunit ribosomal protein L16
LGLKFGLIKTSKKLLLQPKRVKYKKIKKGKLVKFSYKNNLNFGTIGLKALESGLISSRQIEAARQSIVRKIKKKGKLWIKIFPSLPITKKPTEIRMGKGKGNVSHWVARVRGGSVLFEICGVNRKTAIKAFKTGSAKLPIKTQIFD